jgi:hypothetical protein
MHLFLDDVRRPEHVNWKELPRINLLAWVIVRNYEQFTWCIGQFGIPEFVSYDHDLADDSYQQTNTITEDGEIKFDYTKVKEKTGYDCAKWLVNKCLDLRIPHPPFIVHSLNPVGAENITKYIENYNAYLNT